LNKRIFICLFVFILIGCTDEVPKEFSLDQLTRIDVVEKNEVMIISDEKTLSIIREVFKEIKWNPNKEAKMTRKEDIKITLFYTFDPNMPERLIEYRIWFHDDNTATILSQNEKEGYGMVEKEKSDILKDIFQKN